MLNHDHFNTAVQTADRQIRLALRQLEYAIPGEQEDIQLNIQGLIAQKAEAQRRAIRVAQGLTPDDFTH